MNNPYETWSDKALIALFNGIRKELNETEQRRKELIHEHSEAYAVYRKRHATADDHALHNSLAYGDTLDSVETLESGHSE